MPKRPMGLSVVGFLMISGALARGRKRAVDVPEPTKVEPKHEPAVAPAPPAKREPMRLMVIKSDPPAAFTNAVMNLIEKARALRVDALPSLGSKQPAAITDVEIEAVVDAVARRGKLAMARHLLTYLRGAFNHALYGSPALREKYGLKANPADTVGRGRRGKPGKYGRPVVAMTATWTTPKLPPSGAPSKEAALTSRRRSCSSCFCSRGKGPAKSAARAFPSLR